MKKTPGAIIPFSLVLVGFILACGFFAAPKQRSTTDVLVSSPTPTETLPPTLTSTSTPLPATDTPVPATPTRIPTLATYATPEMAPFCDDSEVMNQPVCGYPIAQQSSAICIKKSPYNLIALNDGATYELLHDHIQCSEAGVIDGRRMITCTGPMAFYFELRVCDSACSALEIETESTQCPFGYNYNNLQNCCTNETQEVEQGCVVLKLNTKSCIIDCGEFTSSSTCSAYGYACRWNYDNNTCQLRK